MIKRLIILCLLIPASLFAQFTDDFEDGDITNWTQSTVGRWAVSTSSPLNGSYSLRQIFDNSIADQDRISVPLPLMDLTAQTVKWRFRVKYANNPSATNNWAIFLSSSSDAFGMHPSGSANGYIVGVNYTGDTDFLRLWKVTNGAPTAVISTTNNWNDHDVNAIAPAFEITRNALGEWIFKYDVSGTFNNLIVIGTGTDNTYTNPVYFGLYYKYTQTLDLKLWFDDLSIETFDTIRPKLSALTAKTSTNIETVFNEKMDSVSTLNKSNYFVNGGMGNPDSVSLNRTNLKTVNLYYNQKLINQQAYQIQINNVKDLKGNSIKDTTANFTYEYIKPLSVSITSSNQLTLTFSRKTNTVSAENPLNYFLDNAGGNPISAKVVAGDSTKVLLGFGSNFTNRTNYNLSIQNVADRNQDSMLNAVMPFSYFIPQAFDVVINEIMADPTPEVNLPNWEYIEIHNTTPFSMDITGWKIKIGTTERILTSCVMTAGSYLILCNTTAAADLSSYGQVLGVASFPAITNSGATITLSNSLGTVFSSVSFTTDWYNDITKMDGGWSVERIDPLNTCSGIINWKASIDANGGSPGKVNSVFASNIDNQAPAVSNVEVISDTQLKLTLSETITSSTLLELTNFSIDYGIGYPASLIAGSDFKTVDLIFSIPFPLKTNLKLTVQNLSDVCGNIILTSEMDFVYVIAEPGDIVMNEIMADPDPVIGLPTFEYIEIYNTTEYNVGLTNWTLSAGTTKKTITSGTIKAGEYVILCSESAMPLFQSFGNVLSISGFPSLTNSGQTLVLRNKTDQIISTVTYSDKWYQDEYKAQGGWSLEQIDPLNYCNGQNNWIATKNTQGGTPGQLNSVNASNPDMNDPELLRIAVIDSKNIKLFFSENLDSAAAMQLAGYTVDRNIGNPMGVKLIAPDYKSVQLSFDVDFNQGTVYALEITGSIIDCSGNVVSSRNSARFGIPVSPALNDLAINEVLFNPLSGGYDFVEIYNRSEKIIDLKDVYIGSYDYSTLAYKGIAQISLDGFLIFPEDYVVITENIEDIKSKYFTTNPYGFAKIGDLPSYNDDKGRVLLFDKIQTIIDDFEYLDDMHFALLASDDGVSLERINYNRPANEKTNWHSASEMVGFATPAYKNSQYMDLTEMADVVVIEPEVFSPDNDGFDDVANISFILDEPGYVANIKIFDFKGRLIRYLANNKLLGIEGVISWDGLDEKNRKASVGIYVVYIELFDLKGNVKQYKKKVTVAAMW